MLGTAMCVLQLGWLHTLELPMVFEWIAKFCARWNCAQQHVICSPGQWWLHSGVLLGGARCVQMGQLAPKAPGSPPVSPSYTQPLLLLSTSTPNTDTDSDTDINTVASHPPKGHILSHLHHMLNWDFQMWSLWGNIHFNSWILNPYQEILTYFTSEHRLYL